MQRCLRFSAVAMCGAGHSLGKRLIEPALNFQGAGYAPNERAGAVARPGFRFFDGHRRSSPAR